jgi:hypothetical protein
MMERQRDWIHREWKENELVKPCYFTTESQSEVFQSTKYPGLCYHKIKRTMHLKRLEDQAESFLEKNS